MNSKREMCDDLVFACDNKKCVKHSECKRFKMFKLGETVFHTNGGNNETGCKKFLPMRNEKS